MRSSSIALAVSLALLVRGVRSEECGVRLPPSSDTTAVSFVEVSSLPTPHSTLHEETIVVLTGDILLDRGVRKVIDQHGVGHLFSDGVDSVFKSAQVIVGNLECPATKIKSPVFKRFIFRGEPEWLDTLRKHGITHLNLANNHSIDQGREGLIDTRSNILAAGMVPIGAGENMQEAAQPVLLAEPALLAPRAGELCLPDGQALRQPRADGLAALTRLSSQAARFHSRHHREPTLGTGTQTGARTPSAS